MTQDNCIVSNETETINQPSAELKLAEETELKATVENQEPSNDDSACKHAESDQIVENLTKSVEKPETSADQEEIHAPAAEIIETTVESEPIPSNLDSKPISDETKNEVAKDSEISEAKVEPVAETAPTITEEAKSEEPETLNQENSKSDKKRTLEGDYETSPTKKNKQECNSEEVQVIIEM
jgi:hypothetical protein